MENEEKNEEQNVNPGTQETPPPPPINPEPEEAVGIPGKDECMWGMLCHLTALAGIIIPFGNVIGPLIIWLIKKDEYPFVDKQGKESLNFQIIVTIALLISFALAFVCIGIFLLPIVSIAALVMVIIATIKTNSGIDYKYPFNIRFIK